MKTIIIDDEQAARDVLKNLLARSCPDVKILEMCENVPDGVAAINRLQPDLVFLDVEMPYYAGYELVNFFDKIDFKIIFATAYDQYAIKAFELSAVDYLLKPISRQRLIAAVEKARKEISSKKILKDYSTLMESMQEKKLQKIVIPETNERRIINLNQIIAIEAQRAYSNIFLTNEQKIVVSKPLRYFENVLPDDSCFFRSHKSWMINVNKVESYNKNEGIINLEKNIQAKISKHRLVEFVDFTESI